jgi:hypothetical protein
MREAEMPPDAEDDMKTIRPIEDFQRQLESCRRTSKLDGRDFILASVMSDWFRSPLEPDGTLTNAERVLNAVYTTSDRQPNMLNQLLKHTAENDEKCWLRTFTILLQMKLGNLTMGRLINRFYDHAMLDLKLPFGKDSLFKHFHFIGFPRDEAQRLAVEFWTLQYELCTQKLLNEAYGQIFTYGEDILPITDMFSVREGGSGILQGIEVPYDCLPQSLKDKIRNKTYRSDSDDVSAWPEPRRCLP